MTPDRARILGRGAGALPVPGRFHDHARLPRERSGHCRNCHRLAPTDRGGARPGSAGVAQPVEHLFCKQAVRGSSPLASSHRFLEACTDWFEITEGCPSGQREQAVNLPAYAYVGSNPTPSTGTRERQAIPGNRQDRTTSETHEKTTSPRAGITKGGLRPRVALCTAPPRRWPAGARRDQAGARNGKQRTGGSTAHAGVAQLVERQPSKLNVAGSNPVSRSSASGAMKKRCPPSSVGRARPW